MNDDYEEKPKYACPHCGSTEYITQPDAYSVFMAEGDRLFRSETELVDDPMVLYCRECSEEAPQSFVDAST